MYVDTPAISAAVQFVKDTYPKLRYLNTICTGSALLARTGILDGRRATSNKAFYKIVTAERPAVNWIPKARWVVDGNIYTSSGVSALNVLLILFEILMIFTRR